ncbi:MAG: hypothetical protein FJ011_21645 [Chloroflexi bacterium]|nr:hypothetical protein [Chloroflexota bacterium]
MAMSLLNLTYEVELKPGEKLSLPAHLINAVDAGRWLITIRPYSAATMSAPSIRSHSAFLNSYAPEDEGLYDELPAR